MAGKANSLAVHLVVDDAQLTAGLAKAGAQIESAQAGINKAALTASQGFRASRDAMIEAQRRTSAVLKAGAKLDAETVGNSVDQMTAAYTQYKNAAVSTFNTLSFHQQQMLGSYTALMDASIRKDYEATVAKYDEKVAIDEVTKSLGTNTVALTFNAQAQREATFAIGEAATGRFGRLETSLFSLGARTGLLTKLLSPMGLALGTAAAAAAVFTAAVVEGERESGAFNRAILSTGDAAGLTEGQFNAMAEAISGGDTTIGAARGALLAFAQSGKFAGATLGEAARAALDFANLTGQSMKQAQAAIEQLAEKPAEAIAKLDEQYHFLSVAQYEHIAELEREGQSTQAAQAAVDAFASAMHERAISAQRDEGFIIRGWEHIKSSIDGAWESLKSFGRDTTVDDRIAQLQSKLALVRAGGNGYGDIAAQSAQIEAQIKALEVEKQRNEAAAKHKAEQDQINAAGIRAQQYLDKLNAGTKTQNALLEHEKELTQQIEALHRADPGSADLKGDVFSSSGKLLQGNASYTAIIAKFQKEFSEHPIQLSFTAGKASGADTYSIAEREIREADQALNAINRATQQAAQQRLAIEERVANEKFAISEREIRDANQTLNRIAADQRRVDAQRLAERTKDATKMEGIEDQMLSGLISGQETFATAERRIFQQLAAAKIESALHAATEELIIGRAADSKTRALKSATGLKAIGADAAEAAAGAYKAMVAIPYVGPFIAPVAAATAFAAVGAFKSLVSFDVGTSYVPRDMPAMVHRGEMILPPPQAAEVRSAVQGGGHGGGGGIHHHGDIVVADTDIRRMLESNTGRDALVGVIGKAIRNGALR